jgi:oligopeptide transport system substrate-binding protein
MKRCCQTARPLVLALAVLLAALGVAGCGQPEGPGGVPLKPGVQVLKRGNGAEPVTLDPHRAVSLSSLNVLRDLFEGLVATAPDGTPIPGVAERWETSADGLSWRFELRSTARWSNGEPVTAHDFVAGLQRALDPETESAGAGLLVPILNARAVMTRHMEPEALGIEAPDDHTLLIRLAAPTPWLLELLTHPVSSPLYRPAYAEHGADFARAGRLISNGAFHLSEWKANEYLVLARNHNYWDRRNVAIDQVVYYPIENQDVELEQYQAGKLHWTADVPHHQLGWLQRRMNDELVISPRLAVTWLGLNVTRPPFESNPGLRRALALALDRELIVRSVTGAGEVPAYTWVPPISGYPSQAPSWAALPRRQQLEEARRLYAAAGYSSRRPLELDLLYPGGLNNRRLAIAVAAMWREALGVQTRLTEEPFAEFLESRRDLGTTMVFRSGWAADYMDAFSFAGLFDSETGASDTGWRNVDYDEMLQASMQARNPRRRLALLAQAERLLLEEQPIIPLYIDVRRRLVKPDVRGWEPNPMDLHPSRHFYLAAGGSPGGQGAQDTQGAPRSGDGR